MLRKTLGALLLSTALSCPGHRMTDYVAELEVTKMLGEYVRTLSNDSESDALRKIYYNPLKGENIETAMNSGISPSRIYTSIEYGLLQQSQQIDIRGNTMLRSGIGMSNEQYQQLLWEGLRTHVFLQDVTERGLATYDTKGFSNDDLHWYMDKIGYKK